MKARQCNQIKTCGFLGECKEPAVKGVSSGMCPPCFRKKKAAQKRKEKSKKIATGLYSRHPIPQTYKRYILFSQSGSSQQVFLVAVSGCLYFCFSIVLFLFIILSSSICNPQNPCSIFQLDKQSSRLSPTMMKLMTMLMLMTMVMPMALLTLLFPPWRLLLPPLLLHLPPLLWFVYMFYFEQCFIQLYLFIYLL